MLTTLHGIRGVAAITVVAWHAAALPGLSLRPGSGYLAVDLFFVLSGLVLARAYDARFAHGFTSGHFILARFIRMYPLYLVGILLTSFGLAVAAVFHAQTNWNSAEFGVACGFALLFLPTPPLHNSAIFPLNNPAWSLFFELMANVVFALLWKQLTTRLLGIIIAVSAALLALAAIWYGNLDLGSNWPTFFIGFPRVTYSFFLGVLLNRMPRKRLPTRNIGPILVIAAVAFLLSAYPGDWRPLYDISCVLVILPALIWFGSLVEPQSAIKAIFTGLGAASYPVYAIHVPALTIVAKLIGPTTSGIGPIFNSVFIVTILGAGLLLDRIDQRIRGRLSRAAAYI